MKKIIGLLCALSVGSANAALIDFEGFGGNTGFGDEVVVNGLSIGTSNGFEFTSSGDHFHLGSGLGGVPSNGTGILLEDRGYSITMSQVGGAAFSFLSGDFGEDVSFGTSNSAISILVTGFLFGGGSVVQNILLDGNSSLFENVNVLNMGSVVSVNFQGTGGSGQNGFTLDNLTVASAVSSVPEPTSLALLGLGLAVFCFSRKKKKA